MVLQNSVLRNRAPWGSTGQKQPADVSVYDAMRNANLDFKVETCPVYQKDDSFITSDNPEGFSAVAGHNLIRREDTKKVLGKCGKVWEPLQNLDAFEFFQPFVDSGLARIDTVGSLNGGQKVWILAELNANPAEIVKDDEVAKFILLMNGHDGGTSVRGGFTPIRLLCANMMPMLRDSINQGASQMIRIKHSQHVKQNVNDLQGMMDAANQSFETTADKYRFLASRGMNEKDMERFVRIVLKVDKNKKFADLPTRTQNTVNRVKELIHNGKGNSLKGVRDTWYAALNGMTEYFSHERGRSENNRLHTMFVGTGISDNEKALVEAVKAAEGTDGYDGRKAQLVMLN